MSKLVRVFVHAIVLKRKENTNILKKKISQLRCYDRYTLNILFPKIFLYYKKKSDVDNFCYKFAVAVGTNVLEYVTTLLPLRIKYG
jgi:hypothetical protein